MVIGVNFIRGFDDIVIISLLVGGLLVLFGCGIILV